MLKAGDFTNLAEDYTKSRPGYSQSVLVALLSLCGKRSCSVDFVDVGAGTGIWTRMVADYGVNTVTAVEPNDAMRSFGIDSSRGCDIEWIKGTAETTTLSDQSADLVTMASSFHWADFDKATAEFHRVLRPEGRFAALWNPRLIEVNPLLVEIEAHLDTLRSGIKRVSSGRSGITETLTESLWQSPFFDDVVYIEGRHTVQMSKERYLGAWRSVNDLQVQLGEENFAKFLDYVQQRIDGLDYIEATYLTRAWSARRKG